MWQEIWTTILAEFSDIPDVATVTRIATRLLIAAVLGGILGYERERKSKSAGIRTHMLVAVGTALFVIGPQQSGAMVGDMTRVLQGVIQGIGFLGAGAIVMGSTQERAKGLTTAASIWATAGIGMAAGLGMEATAVLSTVIFILILAVVPFVLPSTNKQVPRGKEPS